MNENAYTITLTDGTVVRNLSKNGDNYISGTPVSADIFTDNCTPVTISHGETSELHEHMELVQITEMNESYWIVLRDISDEELAKIKMQSDIEYIAMMAGVEL